MGSVISNMWWGGDPDAVDVISNLSLRDIYHVQRSWAQSYSQSGVYGMQMFIRLFHKDPSTLELFKSIRNLEEHQIIASNQFQAHVRNLMGFINTGVENLREPEVVAALMDKLGKSHRKNRVEKAYFEEFKEIWIEILEKDLKSNEQTMTSWIRFIDFIYKHIFINYDD